MAALAVKRPPSIDDEIAAYEHIKDELEEKSFGKFVLVYGGNLIGTYDDFDAAASYAVAHFGRGPFLIREVGEQPEVLPASVVYSVSSHGRYMVSA